MKRRKQYTDQEQSGAVNRVLAGERLTAVAADTNVPLRTITKYVKLHRDGTPSTHARRGPPPILTADGERDLVAWVHGMQSNGTPACRAEIFMQASKVATIVSGTRVILSDEWYTKFLGRHKELTNRKAQTATRARNECSLQKLTLLFQTFLKVIIEDNIDAARIYNMDETSFMTRKKSTRVVAFRGSRNVWAKSISPNFHLSVVACGSASSHVIPPLFTLPGQRLSHHSMNECNISGARVLSTSSGFINQDVFVKWVQFFSNSVPSTVKRPLLLLFDGYLSHLSLKLIQVGETLGIRFVCLPANATHLVQPMDIAVFSSYKKKFVHWFGSTCSTQLRRRFDLFNSGGARKRKPEASWPQHRAAARAEILTLPAKNPDEKKRPTRKTVDVAGRLLTREDLMTIPREEASRIADQSRDIRQ